MTAVQRVILIQENLIVGRDEIARRIGYHPNDIPYLVKYHGLKAWRNPGEKSSWKARPKDLDEFNRKERDEWLATHITDPDPDLK